MPTVPQQDPQEAAAQDTAVQQQGRRWLERLFGVEFAGQDPQLKYYGRDPRATGMVADYPGAKEVGRAKMTDLAYGTPMAAYFGDQPPKIPTATFSEVEKAYPYNVPSGRLEPPEQRRLGAIQKGWLAARKSSVAQLGFDPQRTVMTDQPGRTVGLGGYFQPQADTMWFDVNLDPEAIVHESMHRGLHMLRKEGLIPPELGITGGGQRAFDRDELLVRAMMLHHFKDVESVQYGRRHEQVEQAEKVIPKSDIAKIEKIAADYIAKKHPMGPR